MTELIKEIKAVFVNEKAPLESIFHLLSLILVLWSLNPQSPQYNWKVWGLFMGSWLILALTVHRFAIIREFFAHKLWMAVIWPVWNFVARFFNVGTFYNRQVSIALTMFIPIYYLVFKKYREFKLIGKTGLAYLGLIYFTTCWQFLTHPDISRQLAGLVRGALRSSPLLGGIHTVYEAIPLMLVLVYLVIRRKKGRLGYAPVLFFQVIFLWFADYLIARVTMVLFLVLLALSFLWTRFRKEKEVKGDFNISKAACLSTIIYSLPAAALLLFENQLDKIILARDLGKITAASKLINRMRVYFESIVLFQDNPLAGVSLNNRNALDKLGYHSDYFDLLGEYGLVGFLIFILTWFYILLKVMSYIPKRHRGVYILALMSFQTVFMLNPVHDVSAVIVLMFIIPALLVQAEPGYGINGEVDAVLNLEGRKYIDG